MDMRTARLPLTLRLQHACRARSILMDREGGGLVRCRSWEEGGTPDDDRLLGR